MTNNIFNTKKKLLEFIRGNVLPPRTSLLPIPQKGDFSTQNEAHFKLKQSPCQHLPKPLRS